MAKFRKKPVIIDAIENDGTWKPIIDWLDELAEGEVRIPFGNVPSITRHQDGTINITTLEGTMIANIGDYIICGVQGEFYPCKPEIFAETYEEVTNGAER
jgi:hypothetical protein